MKNLPKKPEPIHNVHCRMLSPTSDIVVYVAKEEQYQAFRDICDEFGFSIPIIKGKKFNLMVYPTYDNQEVFDYLKALTEDDDWFLNRQ